jgi:LuxR family quorum-sensing system transcriptional regulator CciR
LDVVQGFIERCEAGESTYASLAEDFHKTLEALGFRHFAFCSHVDPLHPPPHAVMMHNYPGVWASYFSEARLHEVDPVLLRAERDPMPFFWDATFRAEPITKPQRTVLAEAARFGLSHGYTAPLHLSWLPGSLRASCSVVPGSKRINPSSYLAVDALAAYLYIALSRRQAPWSVTLPKDLTPRERQCLALAALGNGDSEIGHILKVSECTAHTHVEHAKQRFGVSTRMQAVVLALMSGEIAYGDVMCRHGVDSPKR